MHCNKRCLINNVLLGFCCKHLKQCGKLSAAELNKFQDRKKTIDLKLYCCKLGRLSLNDGSLEIMSTVPLNDGSLEITSTVPLKYIF